MFARSVAAVTLFILLLTTGACSQGESTVSTATDTPLSALAREGQAIVVALAQAPTSLDPADHRDRTAETVIRNMFDGLVTRDTRNGVHLELAEELRWLDDRRLEVRLRQGVRFHNGVEMTADDVVFTFERIIGDEAIEYPEPHSSPRRGLIAPLQSIEKLDDYTVVMNFTAPWPPALQMLVHQQIVPKDYLAEVGTQGFIAHPIGTGPFRYVSASPDLKEIVLERFEEYYGGAPDLLPVGTACVEQVRFRVIQDAATRVAALLIGDVDIIQSVPLDLIGALDGNPEVQLKTAPGTQPKWIELNVTQPPFDDVRVRRALNFAVDKERIIDEVYGGRAVALPGPLSPFNNFVNQALEPYPYDPDEALALLREAGWIDWSGDGILDRRGQQLSFTLDTLPDWNLLAQAVADQFREIGIEVVIQLWESSVIRPELVAGKRLAYLDDWGDSAFDPVGHFEAKWHGAGSPTTEGQYYGRGNFSGYNNARVNEAIQLGEITADPDERQRLYDEAQQIIYEDAPAVFLVLPEEIEAAASRLQNWEPASDSRINLHDVCIGP